MSSCRIDRWTSSAKYEEGKFEIHSCGLDNEETIATENIQNLELIFEEIPFLWSAIPLGDNMEPQYNYCKNCGKYLDSLQDSFKEFMSENVPNHSKSENDIGAFQKYVALEQEQVENDMICCVECDAQYCCEECKSAAFKHGHQHICGVQVLSNEFDSNGHISLALKAYARIIANAIECKITALESSQQLFQSFHAENYTKTKQAFRTGSIHNANTSIFHDLIAPAYFQAGLAPALQLLRSIFLNQVSNYEQLNIQDILTESYLDALIGTFVCNNISFDIASPISDIYNKFQSELVNKDDIGSFRFPTLHCTALCRTLAKLNHKCNSSTYVSYGNEGYAQIKVHASRDIQTGEQITNSYLHKPKNGQVLSKTQRRKALCQYLFECQCELCLTQSSDRSETEEDDDE